MNGIPANDPSGSTVPVPEPSPSGGKNYLASLLSSGKHLAQPACDRWNTLNSGQRITTAIIGVPIILLPLIWFLIISPWIIVGGLAIYALFFGPRTMIAHLEAALREQLHVPDQTLQRVHENADRLRGQADKVGTNILDVIYWVLYTATVYMLKAVEFIITKLQRLSGLLRSREVTAKEQLASRKKNAKKVL